MFNRLMCLSLFAVVFVGQCTSLAAELFEQEEVITNPERVDGFGAQFQTVIASAIYAELNNKKYVYTPFKNMEHNYTNEPDFIAKKESLINFIDNFEVINEHHVVKSRPNFIGFFESNLDACVNSKTLKKISRVFRSNKRVDNYFNNNNLNIVIHLRRPNSHDCRLAGADTPDNVFFGIINRLRTLYCDRNPLFHIHTQGSPEDFVPYKATDTVLHINESVEDSFTAMVLADVLVAGASSFSYVAAMLSEGSVYYIPFWHAPFPHWISVEKLLS